MEERRDEERVIWKRGQEDRRTMKTRMGGESSREGKGMRRRKGRKREKEW